MINPFNYLYGPVYSWRLGNSLGVDPLSSKEKVCNMDCSYCQLGNTLSMSSDRKEYVSVSELMEEVKRIPLHFIDYITFSGRGEPTLAKNLGDMIRAVKTVRHEKIAVITNSSLLHLSEVQDDLLEADFVLAKLDSINQKMFNSINGVCQFDFDLILRGLGKFRERYKKKFALQIMLVEENIEHVKELSNLTFFLNPHEVQLNTPIRPCAQNSLSKSVIERAKKAFKGVPVVTCYDMPAKEVAVIDEKATVLRHGNYRKSRYVY